MMNTCRHPKLTEIVSNIALMNSYVGVDIKATDQPGKVTGMFMWKKYTCDECGRLITVLQAVVEG